MDFQDAEHRYAELKRQFDAKTIDMDEFNAERKQLMVKDDKGHWWTISPTNDEWTYYDGSRWRSGTPPSGKNGRPPWLLVAGVAAIALVGIAFGWALKSYVAGGPALDEQGKVEGALENGIMLDAAFVHHATPENITDHWTYIDHPLINKHPNAVLFVTPNWNPHSEKHAIHTPHPIGVWYDHNRGRWSIFNEDKAPMAVGAHFNVAVVTNLPQAAMEEGK